MTETTALFETRYRRAFPGTRGITFYDAPTEIARRLARLLEPPFALDEVMLSRGGMGAPLTRFAAEGDGRFVLNDETLRPRRLAAAHGMATARRFFVYLEMDDDALLIASSASPLMSGALEEQVAFLLRLCVQTNAEAFLPEVAAAMERVRYSPYG